MVITRIRIATKHLLQCACLLSASTTMLTAQLTAPAVRLSREVVVDANRAQLVGFSSLVINPAGGFVIQQSQLNQVLFFDDAGKKLATVGRQGQGPGEFTEVGRLGWYADTLWAADPVDDRVTLFSNSGKFIRVIRPSYQTGNLPPAFASRGNRELVNFAAMGLVPGIGLIGTATGIPGGNYFISMAQDGTQPKWISDRPMPSGAASVRTSGNAAGGDFSAAVAQIPHLPQPLSRVSADGRRIGTTEIEQTDGRSGQVKLKIISPLGATILERSYSFTSAAIPRQVLDTAVERIRNRKNQSAQVLSSLEEQMRQRFPRTYPPVTGIRLTKDGSTWLELGNHLPTRSWLRLDARGNPVHTISLPANARFEESDGDVIWASETDDVDLRSVVRYRIQR